MRTLVTLAVAASILFLAVAAAPSALAADAIVCARCGKPISGAYAEVDGRAYHPEHFLCAVCNKPITGEYRVLEGKPYHEKCFEAARPRCAVCGRKIDGEFVVHEGKKYHPSCYQGHVAPRCAICSGIIEGRYLQDYWKNVYHAYHEDEVPRCEYCGRLISPRVTGGGLKYADGRHVCRICLRTAVEDPDEASDILVDVAGILAENGIQVDTGAIQVYLASLDDLAKLVSNARHVRGHTEFRSQDIIGPGGVWKKRSIAVRILHGMPEIDTIATIAHELTHVWRFTRNEKEMDSAFEEGSCNYAAYLVLRYYPGERTDYFVHGLMNDPDAAYGEGFRRVKNLVDSRGKKAWLDLLATGTHLPRGF